MCLDVNSEPKFENSPVLLDYVIYCQSIIAHFMITHKWMPRTQKICEKLTQVNCFPLPYSFWKFVLKTSHAIMIFSPRSWKLANTNFYGINKKRRQMLLLNLLVSPKDTHNNKQNLSVTKVISLDFAFFDLQKFLPLKYLILLRYDFLKSFS